MSIGLPVYNGEAFLSEAIESLLGQEFEDFELIIADNGSTDRTPELIAAFASRDPRVRHLRSETNRGAAWNFNRCVGVARGRYFKWAAHDDVHEPGYLARCVELLERRPEVVLAFARAVDIDESGAVVHVWGPQSAGTSGDAATRFRAFLHQKSQFFEAFGVIRTEVLRRTPLIGAFSSSDVPLIAELALHGPFGEVDEVLFRHREHPGRSIRVYAGERGRTAWFDTRRSGRTTFPSLRMATAFIGVVRRAPLGFGTRLRVIRLLGDWLWGSRMRFVRDLARPVTGLTTLDRFLPEHDRQPTCSVGTGLGSPSRREGADPLWPRAHPGSVSIVVVARDGQRTLGPVLETLFEQRYDGNWEVIVIDHGSVDNTPLIVRGWQRRFRQLRLLELQRSQRIDIDLLTSSAVGELLVFCRPDHMVHPAWLDTLVDTARYVDIATAASVLDVFEAGPLSSGTPAWSRNGNLAVWCDIMEREGLAVPDGRPGSAARFADAVQRTGLRVERVDRASYDRIPAPTLAGAMAERFRYGREDGRPGLSRSRPTGAEEAMTGPVPGAHLVEPWAVRLIRFLLAASSFVGRLCAPSSRS